MRTLEKIQNENQKFDEWIKFWESFPEYNPDYHLAQRNIQALKSSKEFNLKELTRLQNAN